MARKVNLDALIPREDFDVTDTSNLNIGHSKDTLAITDLPQGEFFISALRKPDFQRETNEWTPEKICDFIESFLDGDLIPAIILWRSAGSFTFVIDGSHRISALAAWINDDYGDGAISKQFYDGVIPDEQIRIAEATRSLIKKRVGSYSDHRLAAQFPEKVKPAIAQRVKSLGALGIRLQWVQGDSSKAESSFFKINQQASPIDPTELRVLKARKNPSGLAARAIVRSGRGHKYWSAFSSENQQRIQELAKEINEILFEPKLDNPIKTLDLPIGGKVYAAQSMPLVLDFINIVNQSSEVKGLGVDTDGSDTIKFLTECRRVARRINSVHPSSLGLHPIVYFYSQNGRHKPASFFAITALMIEMDRENLFAEFTRVRQQFEEFLLRNDYLIQQIVRRYRSAIASFPHIKDFYLASINGLLKGMNEEEVIKSLTEDESYQYLTQFRETAEDTGQDFSRETKSEAFIREALASALKCRICGGYIHRNSITIDHITRKQDGGSGNIENAQLAHPYCNSTAKN